MKTKTGLTIIHTGPTINVYWAHEVIPIKVAWIKRVWNRIKKLLW